MRATPETIVVWEQRIRQREQSGMSIAAWCKENKIKKSNYQYWNRKLNKEITINNEAEFADVSSILSNSVHLNKEAEISKKD
ncbi:IS66 family insertion sequence element accessory protein TnpA [Haloimpatiens sp. FM7315]|uniref:IS66 family insertion sequence element accessory protein TnpA n=1 Tax=Haloimpatiens sp. FM7315 TaxID=3298609 RepID=UPI00370A0C0E